MYYVHHWIELNIQGDIHDSVVVIASTIDQHSNFCNPLMWLWIHLSQPFIYHISIVYCKLFQNCVPPKCCHTELWWKYGGSKLREMRGEVTQPTIFHSSQQLRNMSWGSLFYKCNLFHWFQELFPSISTCVFNSIVFAISQYTITLIKRYNNIRNLVWPWKGNIASR